MARPKKYDIDTKEVEKLAGYGCSAREIADFFGCDESLISKSYSSFITKGKANLKKKIKKSTARCSIKRQFNNVSVVGQTNARPNR